MAVFSSFNKLNNKLSEAHSDVRQVGQTISSFTANIDRTASQARSFLEGNNPISRGVGEITDTARNVRNTLGTIDNLINGDNGSVEDVGKTIRMAGNAAQNITQGAAPPAKKETQAVISSNIKNQNNSVYDWRVSLTVPNQIMQGSVLETLGETDNKMIFPFNPTILLSHSANYATIQPTHTNYVQHAYESSQVDNITITGEFFQENEADARYWVACLHYLRTMTKMFYGSSSDNLGNPPLIARLNGYGKHVLNNIPVVITNFTTDIPADVDYISCTVGGEINYIPMQSVLTVTCAPNYARRSHARFSLQDYASGRHINGQEGFI